MEKHIIGIDVSKADFHCCVGIASFNTPLKLLRSGKFTNSLTGFKHFTKWIKETQEKKSKLPLRIVLEATGVYFENLALYLYKEDFEVCVVLPNNSKKYLEATGQKSKNDKADAKGLCRMGAERELDLWQPLGGYFYELRSLTRHYQMIQEQITAINNNLEACRHGMYQIKSVIKSNEKILRELEKQLEAVRVLIDQHIESNAEVKEKVDKIIEIKGVSQLTVAVVIAETNGFELFKNSRQLVSYAGYDIVENQSGKRIGRTKISKKGNSRLRRAMHMPALNVVRYDEGFKNFFQRLYDRHGIKMKGYVAVQKKLLTTIYALWKKNEYYDKNYWNTFRERSQELPLDGLAEAKKVSLAMQG